MIKRFLVRGLTKSNKSNMHRHRKVSNQARQYLVVALAIIAVSLVGLHFLNKSNAASPYVSSEAENGSLLGAADKQKDSTASGGSYIQFGGSQVVTSPIADVPAGITLGSAYETEFNAMSSADQATAMALMKSDGVQWLRIDMYSAGGNNVLMKDAVANGIKVDAILQDWSATNPPTPAASAAFATTAVNHAKLLGVETYEILNEPNGCEDTMDAATYTAILQANYTAIKAADPNAFVITGGLCPASGSNEPYNYLTAMYADGAKGYFDAFNLHPYSYPDTPDQTGDSWNPWSYLPQLHSIMASNGDGNKQIWLTEFGCPTPPSPTADDCTDATYAQQITDAFTSARALPYIGPLLIYNWQDGGGQFDGFYAADGTPKPLSLAAYEAAAGQ